MSASPRRSQCEADPQARFRVCPSAVGPRRGSGQRVPLMRLPSPKRPARPSDAWECGEPALTLREARRGRPTTQVLRAAFDAVSLTDLRLVVSSGRRFIGTRGMADGRKGGCVQRRVQPARNPRWLSQMGGNHNPRVGFEPWPASPRTTSRPRASRRSTSERRRATASLRPGGVAREGRRSDLALRPAAHPRSRVVSGFAAVCERCGSA
jgi:hypothetical protein